MLTVDPGITGTGVAHWENRELVCSYNLTSDDEFWPNKVNDISKKVFELIHEYATDVCPMFSFVYELPTYMAHAQKQNLRGDITKLSILAGALHGAANCAYGGAVITPCPIVSWKGQTPKEIMNNRTERELEAKGYRTPHHPILYPDITSHELDAIGIGFYILGEKHAAQH